MKKCHATALVLQLCMPLDYYSWADQNALSALNDLMLAITNSVSPQANYQQHEMAAAAAAAGDVLQI